MNQSKMVYKIEFTNNSDVYFQSKKKNFTNLSGNNPINSIDDLQHKLLAMQQKYLNVSRS